jgi:hypothetical protein
VGIPFVNETRFFALNQATRGHSLAPIFMSAFSLAGYYTLEMILDCDLLRRYAETESEDAFAELVGRHVNLVYSAAMQQFNREPFLNSPSHFPSLELTWTR